MRKLLVLSSTLVAVTLSAQTRRIDDATLKGGAGDDWLTYGLTQSERDSAPSKTSTRQTCSGSAWPGRTTWAPAAADRKRRRSSGTARSTASRTGASCSRSTRGPARRRWRWDPEVNQTTVRPKICCGVVNRGIALYNGMVIAPVDRRPAASRSTRTPASLCGRRASRIRRITTPITMAPRIAKGKVIIGASGGDRPTRGFFDGLRRDDGPARVALLHGARRSVEAVRERGDEESRGDMGRRMVEDRRRRRGVGRHGLRSGRGPDLRRHRQRRAVGAAAPHARRPRTTCTSARSSPSTPTPAS